MALHYSEEQASPLDRIEFFFPRVFEYYIVVLHGLYLIVSIPIAYYFLYIQDAKSSDLPVVLFMCYMLAVFLLIRKVLFPIKFKFDFESRTLRLRSGILVPSHHQTLSFEQIQYLYIRIKASKHGTIHQVKLIDHRLKHLSLYRASSWQDAHDYMLGLSELTQIEYVDHSDVRFVKDGHTVRYVPEMSFLARLFWIALLIFGGLYLCSTISFSLMPHYGLPLTMLSMILFVPGIHILGNGTPNALH